MNPIKNRVQLIGHLGANPEVKVLESGKKMARFAVAINESYKNQQGEKVNHTSWHQIVAWGPQAELASRILEKGSQVAVEGKLGNREYTDREGRKHLLTEVTLSYILVLGAKQAK